MHYDIRTTKKGTREEAEAKVYKDEKRWGRKGEEEKRRRRGKRKGFSIINVVIAADVIEYFSSGDQDDRTLRRQRRQRRRRRRRTARKRRGNEVYEKRILGSLSIIGLWVWVNMMAGTGVSAGGGGGMLRARRRDVSVKPNRKLDRKSSRGMIYENEELRLRTIHINAEVEQGKN